MRHRFSLGLLALLLSLAPSALAQTYVATLAGANEVPAVTTDASGTVFATVDGMDVTISGSFSGLESDYAASHVHTGPAGMNGGVIFALAPTVDADNRGGTFDQTLTFTQAQLDALASDGLYINVHSANNGGGEIRGQLGGPVTAFVNELHYDNASTDEGEFVEIAVPTGTDVNDLVLTLYNGNGGVSYGTFTGDMFTAGATTGGFTLYSISTPGIQNGAPDGLALSTAGGTVLQFLSYEGTMDATDGPAAGMTSTDIIVLEESSTNVGQSLQLTGAGTVAADFTWTGPIAQTRGAANTGQTLGGGSTGGGGGGGDPVTIAEARAAGVGATVTVEGTVTRAMGDFLYLQDETAGLAIRQEEGDLFDAVADGTVGPGTVLRVTGTLSEFAESLQINAGDLTSFEDLGTDAIPEPQTVTLAELSANGEAYEDELVRVENVTINGVGVFEAATTYDAADGSGAAPPVTVRVPNADDSTVDGTTIPAEAAAVTLIGIVGQFNFDMIPDEGYQLLLISADDVNPEGVASEGGPDGALTLALANPIRGTALITFGAETAGAVRLAVFDALGREVAVLASGDAPAGVRSARLDARALAPGVYVVRLETAAGSATRTVTVVR